jgi:hypothetical protein
MANNVALSGFNINASTVVGDTSPQLGGNLDLNSNNITGTGNINTTGTVTASGTITGATFSGSGASLTSLPSAQLTGALPAISGANLTGINTDLVSDTTPQLGGNLDAQTNNITNLGTINTHTIPGGTGTLALTSNITLTPTSTDTFTNKTINLASNTLSGTTAQFNTALSDGSFRIGYQPGEIIEQLETQADGVAVTVQSGTYTPTNVTAIQDLSTSHAVINGSSIGYTPPTGTTRVIYEFWVYMRDTDVAPILHFAGRVAGTQVTNARHTFRGATAGADYQRWMYNKMILRVGVTESLAAGDVGTWTSSKTIDFTAREYSSTYEGRFHSTNNWDGAGTDIIVKPRIRITAIA